MNNQIDRARNIGATAAPRSTQVELMLSNLSEEIGFLEKVIEAHMNKIAPVLRSQCPVAEKANEPKCVEDMVPVAGCIRTMAERVSFSRRRMEDLTERTEA